MNYLAHIFLSGDNPRIQVGNFIGDAVKGNAYRDYQEDIRKGILLHRKIDDFTDHHPLMKETVTRLRDHFGRYSGVVADMYFDYFLAENFKEYAGVSLRSFTLSFYITLIRYYHSLPLRFRRFLWHFILTDRLYKYRKVSGIRRSLEIMSEYKNLRVSADVAADYLQCHHDELNRLFRHFFPELQVFSREILHK